MVMFTMNLLKISCMSKKRREIEIRSDEVNDILSKPPSWMVRIGSTLMLFVLLLIILGSAVFRYPDIIRAPIVITSENLPAQLIAKRSGRIQAMLAKNGDTVKRGAVIAILENPGLYEDYLKMMEVCASYLDPDTQLPEKLILGEMQSAYSQLVKSIKEYRSFFVLDYHRKMITSVREETETKRGQLQISQRKVQNAKEQFDIAGQQFARDKQLFEQRTIAQQDLDKSRSNYLYYSQQLEVAREELSRISVDVIKGEQTILDLEIEREEGISRLKRAVEADLQILLSQVREWEQLNLFVSPVDGTVSFTSYWQENQNVLSGEVVFPVLPVRDKNISGKLYIPLAGAGKVKIGQKVNVKLDSYPYMEYGMVVVSVKSISLLPATLGKDRVYIVSVDFPDGLKTTYSQDLLFSEEMHGTGEIVTHDVSLLRRVFYPVKHMLKTHF